MSHNEQEERLGADDFIEQDQIDEVLPDEVAAAAEPADDEDKDEMVVNLENNSHSYFDQHKDSIFLVASHPTLPMVVTGGGDDTGFLWATHQIGEATRVFELTGHSESVACGGFTYDGEYLVTGDMTGQLRVWKMRQHGEKWEFVDSVQEVEEIAWISFHPSQHTFALGASDGTVWCYTLDPKLSNVAVLSGAHTEPVSAGQFVDTQTPELMSLVTISDDCTVAKWNVFTGTAEYILGPHQLHGEHPWTALAVSPTERTFAIGSYDGSLQIINTSNGNLLHSIQVSQHGEDEGTDSIESISWGPGANVLAVGNVAGEITLYDLGSWQKRRTIQCNGAITKLKFVGKTPYLFSSCFGTEDEDATATKWDARSGSNLWTSQGHEAAILDFDVQDNGRRLITGGDDKVGLVFSTESSQSLTTTSTTG